jgi:uncharacterized membrane protein
MSRTDPDAPARRDEHEGEGATRGTGRMEAFADGVFAIAFTLPIFNVLAPEFRDGGQHLAEDLLAAWPQDAGYVLASVIIGLYWVHHHFSGAIYRTTGHWFLIGTGIFLAMIGYIAFPARIFADSLLHPAALPAASAFLVECLALTSATWLLKWNIGMRRGNVDPRLKPEYVARLNRRYWLKTGWNVAAAILVNVWWLGGLIMSGLGLLHLLWPPETPRYLTQAPVIEDS